MNVVKKDCIEWHLEDDRLRAILDPGLLSNERRPFWVREYDGKKAFIKLFREKGVIGALRNLLAARGQREFNIGLGLQRLSIPTPQPLGYGKGRMCSASIQEWKEGKDFFTAFCESTDRSQLLRTLSSLLTALKRQKVRHNDLHLRNIIVSHEIPHIIDLHKTAIKRTFTRSDELTNMCHTLFSIYADMTEEEKVLFFGLYGDAAIRPLAEANLTRMRRDWAYRKRERAFRTTSLLQANGSVVRIKGAVQEDDGHFIEHIKQDKKTQVERYSNHIRKVYRNRRRLKSAWENHVALEYMELAVTPRPFYVRKASLGRRGFIAMEDLERKGEDLSRFLDANYSELVLSGKMAHFIQRFSSFLLLLIKREIRHKDLKTSNIFILRDGSFRLLDIEDIRFEGLRRDFLGDMMAQLNKSVPKRVRMTHRLRFFSRVTKGVSLPRAERKALLRSVREESLRDDIVYVGVSGTVRETWR
jgi:tRNA A-37 threonylcarbamoyl transferase component Bud32